MLAAGCLALAVANYAIYSKEQLRTNGRIVLLELAPVDPRSMMQGDYMALRFTVADIAVSRGQGQHGLRDGSIVLKLDDQGVGTFDRFDDHLPLSPDEVRMRYRVRDGKVKFATNAFFFQEGDAKLYAGARYGELRLGDDGETILTGLRGKDLAPLGRAERQR